MIEFVLDTNTLSELMRRRPNSGVEAKLKTHREACSIPATVIDDLQFGVSRMADDERREAYQAWLENLVAEFPIVPIDGLCAQWLGRERARLGAIGKPPPAYDGLIAAVAVVNELVLVTHNTANFDNFEGIRLQDWFKT